MVQGQNDHIQNILQIMTISVCVQFYLTVLHTEYSDTFVFKLPGLCGCFKVFRNRWDYSDSTYMSYLEN